MLRAALAPLPAARASWREATLDLDDPVGADLHALLGWRIGDLDPDHPLAPRLRGVLRRNVTANAVALARLAGTADNRLVTGRLASLAAYLPMSGLVELVSDDLAEVGPVCGGRPRGQLLDIDVCVPTPSVHLVDAVIRRRPVDAAFALAHPGLDWTEVREEAARRGRRRAMWCGIVLLADVVGVVPPDVLKTGRAIGLAERLRRAAPI